MQAAVDTCFGLKPSIDGEIKPLPEWRRHCVPTQAHPAEDSFGLVAVPVLPQAQSSACTQGGSNHPDSLLVEGLVNFFSEWVGGSFSDYPMDGLRAKMGRRGPSERQRNIRIRDRILNIVSSGHADLQRR